MISGQQALRTFEKSLSGERAAIDEIRQFRTMVGGATKAEQIRRTGAELLVAPCANCKKQLGEIIEDHRLEDVEVIAAEQLNSKAEESIDSARVRIAELVHTAPRLDSRVA